MALLHMDGFEQFTDYWGMQGTGVFSSTSTQPCKWTAANPYIDSTVYRTTQPGGVSKSMRMNGNGYFGALNIPTSSELYMGFNFRTSGFYDGTCSMLIPTTTANLYNVTTGIQLYRNSNGSLTVARISPSAVFFTTNPNTIIANTWYFIELKIVFGVTGSLELRIEGMTIGSATSVDTKGTIGGAGFTHINYYSGYNDYHYFDDIYVCDGTGATNNTFLGPSSVYTLFPNAAGTTTNMTPVGAASNWDCVNENNYDSNTTYVQTSAVNQIDYYNVSNLGVSPANVYGVKVGSISCKGTYGTRTMRNKIKLGASVVDGATSDPQIYLNYRKMEELLETKPGGGAWTAADVDALEVGIESTP